MGQTEDMSPFFPGAPDTSGWDPHFVIVRSARVWVDIDSSLTAKTITRAADLTRRRRVG